ncbi:MAG: RNA methyltransferase [Spirochaetaceae bacterium]|jgi:TrmH RNA methyltransferase|nr:RNA methyltransferase [Spirochaetaceae bacterium]GMO17871.1 MAG: RNA methyltransferase [Termitinemataceae bacterium]
MNETAVCSINAVRALAAVSPDEVRRLFIRKDRLEEFAPLCKRLAELKRPYKICDDEEIERLCKTPHHQGIAAMIAEKHAPPLTREDLDEWDSSGALGVILHDVGNEFNFGAIVRQAAFFEARYVVISELDEAARLSTAAYRAAQGGMQYVTLRSVHRTEAFLKDAEKRLLTIGAEHRARRRIRDLGGIIAGRQLELGRRPGIALVVGNEERGLPEPVKAHCSALLRIPGSGFIESLNVAQAAALFCHEIFES